MKLFISLSLILCSFSSFAIPSIKAGLWKLESNIEGETPADTAILNTEIKNNYNKLSQVKKKDVDSIHGQLVASTEGDLVCLSAEVLKNKSFLNPDKTKKCSTKINSQTETRIKTSFKCNDGSFGTGSWSMFKGESYLGTLDITTKAGKKIRATHKGTFMSSNCQNQSRTKK